MYQSPTMKTKEEILKMVELFDQAAEQDAGLEDDAEAAVRALNWVLGHHDDATLTGLIDE